MSTITPGPWELTKDGDGFIVTSESQYMPILVAKVYATDKDDDIGDVAANAVIIKAAPKLLAALQGIVELVRTYRGNWTESPPMNIAIAAIAEANWPEKMIERAR